MGCGLVAHISPHKGLRIEPIADFAGDRAIRIKPNGGNIPETLLWERLETFRNNPHYDFFTNNCEYLCNFLETGAAFSTQLQGGMVGFAVGCAAVRYSNVENPLAAIGLIILTTCLGAKIGAPKAPSIQPFPAF